MTGFVFAVEESHREELIDQISAPDVNAWLNKKMEGLSAKVFQICRGSMKLQEQLNRPSTAKTKAGYQAAVRKVAFSFLL